MNKAKLYRSFDSGINCDVEVPSKLGPEYGMINIDSAIRSHECKAGMIAGDLHKTKFSAEQIEFIDRCRSDKPQTKFAYELVKGNISAKQFSAACDVLHKLTHWSKQL